VVIERVSLHTADGLTLEGELTVPDDVRAAAVLAHPHPLFGGSMRSIVVGALFDGLPAAGVAALRFNFRGVGNSKGVHDEGKAEKLDVVAALDALHAIVEGLPLVLTGWSFGADVSLTVDDERHGGWFAVAPPLRHPDASAVAAGADPRPKLLAVPEHDQYRSPTSARDVTAAWAATRVEVIPGADHFLVGRTDRAVELALGFVDEVSRAER
jgi:alpha/beta superfamily hydrolase